MKIKTAGIGLTIGIFLSGTIIISLNSISLSKIDDVQTIWIQFEEQRNDRLRTLNALRSEIGYGGMIHNFKNYLLRHNQKMSDAVISSIGGAKAAIRQYKSLQLSSSEKRALLQIENTVDKYKKALALLAQLIQQKKSIQEIDSLVKINDKPALNALNILNIESNDFSDEVLSKLNKPLLLSKLKKAMGYGGLIHNYKNYILRHSSEAKAQVEAEAHNIKELIEQYQQLKLSKIEQNALKKIQKTVQAYQNKLPIIHKMIIDGLSIYDIDKVVAIDDTPAIDGFDDLQRQIVQHNENRALKLYNSLEIVHLSGHVIFLITLITFLFIISLTIWLIQNQITLPIQKLTDVMSRLSNDDLTVEVLGTGSTTEIGEMARSVEIFKENAIKKQAAEQSLQLTKEQLEEKVKERTQKLKENETRLTALVENAVDAIITIDSQGVILSFNAAAIAMFGYPAYEVIGQNINILMPEPYKSEHDRYLQNYLTTGKKNIIGIGREVSARRKNGEIFSIELAVSEVPDTSDKRVFIGIIRDISDKKEKELALQISKKAADEANKAKSDFLSSMSHELRTPMNAILGFSQLLAMDTESPLTQNQQGNLSEITMASKHLLNLINEVLDLSKIESGIIELSNESVALSDILIEALNLMTPLAEKRGISITLLIDGVTITTEQLHQLKVLFQSDSTRLKQVFLNLLSNAVKYNRDNGNIYITGDFCDNNQIRLSVSDTGIGIPIEKQAQLFKPFNRLGVENTTIEGTGIGLVITKKIIELMGGHIGFESTPAEGSTFWIELPYEFSESTQAEVTEKNVSNDDIPAIDNVQEHTILYIEDNLANLRLVQQTLKMLPRITLLSAHEPLLGLELAFEHKPELILLDINLPGMNGFEVLKRIRQDQSISNTPVIAVSANAMSDTIQKGLDSGFDEYIIKPIDVALLLETVKKILIHVHPEIPGN